MKHIFTYMDSRLAPFIRLIPASLTPNHLSLIRLLLTLPVALLIVRGPTAGALVVFAIGILTDLLDGPLARSRKQQSPSGELLDALADKVFFSVPFLILGASLLPAILYIGIAIVELVTLLGGFVAASVMWLYHTRYLRIKGETLGKIKIGLYFVATIILLMPSVTPTLYLASLAIYSAGLCLAVVSITNFLVKLARKL